MNSTDSGDTRDVVRLSLASPADIRGWEVITYRKGQFEELRSKLSAFLRNTLPYRSGSAE